jgi:hypothetical protein
MEEFKQIEWLFPQAVDYASWRNQRPDVPFSEDVLSYLNALSASLLRDPQSRQYPDVVTFAFFCRRANVLHLKEIYQSSVLRLGRGMVFHIAPSNVPINFAYSLVAGLLAGNHNVVRVSSKSFVQVDILLRHMAALQSDYPELSNRIAIVRYEHDSNANAIFSADCHVRVIWGGDRTIQLIRQNALPARSFDICFADRYSLAVLNADRLVNETDMDGLAQRFYNDTYLFDQNACSAPHLVVWLGENGNVIAAKEAFWSAVQRLVDKRYPLQDIQAVDKLTALYRQAVAMDIQDEPMVNNRLRRVELKELVSEIDDYRCASGYFSEYTAQSVDDIVPIIKNKYQTLAYYGLEFDTLRSFVERNRICGIDRIVPIGDTTAFSLIWDGYDLIEMMSRIVDVR